MGKPQITPELSERLSGLMLRDQLRLAHRPDPARIAQAQARVDKRASAVPEGENRTIAGEEGGAALMIKEGVLDQDPKPQAIFALHVLTQFEVVVELPVEDRDDVAPRVEGSPGIEHRDGGATQGGTGQNSQHEELADEVCRTVALARAVSDGRTADKRRISRPPTCCSGS
jgi:hypothetical protein